MADINTTAAEWVAAKLREQASAHTQLATTLNSKPHGNAAWESATLHSETARLFVLLHAAVTTDGLLDWLQLAAAEREAVPA